MKFFPIQSKVALQKKKRAGIDRGSQQDDGTQRQDQDYPRYLQIAPRAYIQKELTKIENKQKENLTKLKVSDTTAPFPGNKELVVAKNQTIDGLLCDIFQDRLNDCKKAH